MYLLPQLHLEKDQKRNFCFLLLLLGNLLLVAVFYENSGKPKLCFSEIEFGCLWPLEDDKNDPLDDFV